MHTYVLVPIYVLVVFGSITASAQLPPQQAQSVPRLSDLVSQNRLEAAERARAASAASLSNEPDPAPTLDQLTAVPLGISQEQANLNNQSVAGRKFDGLDDSVKWLIIGGVLVVVWQIVKALGRGAKAVSKTVVNAAVDASPAVKQAASRVGSTALGGAKSFFAETKKCPNCAELIKKEAKVCRYCQRAVS